jgi:hypothetical protein
VLPAVVGGLVALFAVGGTAEAALLEPVSVTATAPETAAAGTPFKLEVTVEAEAGALDIAAAPLKLGVKLAPECGGSFVGTAGPAALEQILPNPTPGAAYSRKVTGQVSAAATGTNVICAFLQDSQERQFATDTEAEVSVVTVAMVRQCTAATKQLKGAKRKLKRLEHRIHKVKGKVRKAQGAHRKALTRKLHKLQTHERRASKRRKSAAHRVAGVCP